MIRFIKHKDLDFTKWDACIHSAANSRVYALSGYLNIVALRWNALVLDNYKAVMPLPWKRKFGIPHIYHPLFCQQLGVFYPPEMTINIKDWMQSIPFYFLKIEIAANSGIAHQLTKTSLKPNFLLPIHTSYHDNYLNFNQNTRRNIKKADKNIFEGITKIDAEAFLQLKKENPVNSLTTDNYKTLSHLFTFLKANNLGEIYGARNEHNELLAAALFITFKNRIIYLFSASSAEGKQKRAMFKIINEMIIQNQGKALTLDFEGSAIPGVAKFFSGFGAQPEHYARLSCYPVISKCR